MVTAVVLIKAEREKVNEVAEKLADAPGVSEAYSVAGRYDLVAIVRAENNEALAAAVTHHLVGIDGILDTETLFAFRAHSRHDLDSMFSIGI